MERSDFLEYREELQQRVSAMVAQAGDSMVLLEELNLALDALVPEYKERCAGRWNDGEHALLSSVITQALAQAESAAIFAAQRNDSLRDALRQYFLLEGPERHDQGRVRYDQIARLGDEQSASLVFDAAAEMLPEYEHDFNPCPFFGLAHLVTTQEYGARARDFLVSGFDAAIAAGEDDMVSDRTFVALGRAIGALRDESFAKPLLGAIAYAGEPERDYGLNVAACELAMQLIFVGYLGPVEPVESLCAYLNDTYRGEDFAMRGQYALWMLLRDPTGVEAYLADRDNDRGLGWAATALADLDHKPARSLLDDRLREITNVTTREIFAEAAVRLNEQLARPSVDQLMVWLHGFRTRAELMEGMDADNIFEIRASLSTGAPVGRIYELDDSSAADV